MMSAITLSFICVSNTYLSVVTGYCWCYGEHRAMVYMLTELQSVSSVAQSYPTLCDPIDCSMPGFPVHHQLLELTQTHVHPVSDAIQPSHPLSSPSLPTFNLSQHQGVFQWVSSSHKVAKVLEFQHQSFQWLTVWLTVWLKKQQQCDKCTNRSISETPD